MAICLAMARTTEGQATRAFATRLGACSVFQGLGDGALEAIAASGVLRSLRAEQVLWRQGTHAYELALVWEGQLRVERELGGRVTYRAVQMNEVIGFSNAIGRAVCTVDVVAAEPSRVLLVPGDVLRGLVPRYPEIAFRALEHMGALVGKLSDEVELLHHGSLEGRVIRRLRQLAEGRREVRITHQGLAEQVAARRESVTRTLAELGRRGVIRCRRGVIEVDKLGDV